ncbi:GH25 family lysozyme [Lactobacillus hominis]|uniref:GH25 family lysozyme n=1 Tax=Lactobacillus hominis TaxID=1203033 RepID=UPI0023F08A44|nr:GH25 family lysozyme [Lactobacillus hominis]
MTKQFGADVSSNNPPNVNNYARFGSKFVIVKLTEGTTYRNPSAKQQIASAIASGQTPHGYFFAVFSDNSYLAQLNAELAISQAKALGLPAGSILATDWEVGDGNEVTGPVSANTQAILVSMRIIQKAGYKPMLYSGAYNLKNRVNRSLILKEFPDSLWVAAYPLGNGVAISQPDFSCFPSMDGVAIWQFTDNWCNQGVDGNIALIDFSKVKSEEVDDELNWHPQVKYNELGQFKINRPNGADLYEDASLKKVVGHRPNGATFKINRAKDGAVCAGTNQWFSQADGLTKINPLAVNPYGKGIAQITADNAWTQNNAKPDTGIKHLEKGSTWHVLGRSGKYLLIGNEQSGKFIDGDKVNIIL